MLVLNEHDCIHIGKLYTITWKTLRVFAATARNYSITIDSVELTLSTGKQANVRHRLVKSTPPQSPSSLHLTKGTP